MNTEAIARASGKQDFSVCKLGGVIGAELRNVRLKDIDGATFDAIRDAAIRNRVVVFRDQFFEPEDLVAFAGKLGPFMTTRGLGANPDWPDLHVVSNPGKKFAITESWHTDASTSQQPPSFTVLAAQILPESGGDTMFCNMVDAYDSLSDRYKALLQGMRLHHVNRLHSAETLIEMWHPLVRSIPETGERAIYGVFKVGESLEGMTKDESQPIINFLFNHAINPERVYRHRWLPGDVVMWDNRSTMHYAVHDFGDAERTLIRAMVQGEAPFEAAHV